MSFKDVDFRVATVKNEDGSTEIYFEHVNSWDDFDLLLKLLQQENDCEVLSNEEMIYIRKAELSKNGVKFQLWQDDMLGNYLYTNEDNVVPILEKMANNVIDSIKAKLEKVGSKLKDGQPPD